MKKYKLVFTPQLSLEVSSKQIKANLPTDWRHFFYRLSNILAGGLLAYLVLSLLFRVVGGTSPDSNNLYNLIAVEVALAFIFVWQLLVVGWKRFIDPPGFIGVLVFALGSILAWIFSPTVVEVVDIALYRRLSTFGDGVTKGIAGLAVIGLVGLFYFINLYLDKAKKVNMATWMMLIFVLAGAVANFVFSNGVNQINLTVLAAMSLLGLWQLTKIFPERGLFVMALVLISLVSMFINAEERLWPIYFSAIGALLVWLWAWLLCKNFTIPFDPQGFMNDLKSLRDGKSTLGATLESHKMIYVLLLVLVLAVSMVIWVLVYGINIGAEIQNTMTYFVDGVFGQRGLPEILLGNARSQDITAINSSLTNVFVVQGLAGLVAYLILGFTGYFVTIRQMWAEAHAKKKQQEVLPVGHILAPIIFFVPILSLFLNVSLLVTIVWWITLGIVAAAYYLPKRPHLKLVKGLKINGRDLGKFIPWLQALVGLLLLLGWVYLNTSLLDMLSKGFI